MKNNKGITLVALVVTIIVLLILAGVVIAMLSGNNGVITQAQNAKTETIRGEVKDQVDLAYMAAKTQLLANDSIAATELLSILSSSVPTGYTVTPASVPDPLTSPWVITISNGTYSSTISATTSGTNVTALAVPTAVTP